MSLNNVSKKKVEKLSLFGAYIYKNTELSEKGSIHIHLDLLGEGC